MHPARARPSGFTLIELMVTVAVIALLATLAGPSFRDMILMQRLRGVESQVVTDMQFARAEAVQRGKYMFVKVDSDTTQTCYTIYYPTTLEGVSNSIVCSCTRGAGTACTTSTGIVVPDVVEVRTVSIPRSSGVELQLPLGQDSSFAFDYVTGGLLQGVTDDTLMPLAQITIHSQIDDVRRITTQLSQSGRPRSCGTSAANVERMQVPPCQSE